MHTKKYTFIQFFAITIALSGLLSCGDDESENDGEELALATITVFDADSWVAENTQLQQVQGAVIELYKDEDAFNANQPDYTITTDNNGEAQVMVPVPIDNDGDGFFDENSPNFLITIEKGTKSNFKDGFSIDGVFTCASDLDFAAQEGATLGGIQYADVNGDGVINSSDLTGFAYIFLKLEGSGDGPSIDENDPELSSCAAKPSSDNATFIAN